MQSEPQNARILVWALPISLAATFGIDLSFFSSGYLDVSVHRVPLHNLWIQLWIRKVFLRGFPHSDICGSLDICSSPQLFAAYHVFLRLLVPRHPPCALISLTYRLRKRFRLMQKLRADSSAKKLMCQAVAICKAKGDNWRSQLYNRCYIFLYTFSTSHS